MRLARFRARRFALPMPLRSKPIKLASVLWLCQRRGAIVQGHPDFGAERPFDPGQELLKAQRIEPDTLVAEWRTRRHIAITALSIPAKKGVSQHAALLSLRPCPQTSSSSITWHSRLSTPEQIPATGRSNSRPWRSCVSGSGRARSTARRRSCENVEVEAGLPLAGESVSNIRAQCASKTEGVLSLPKVNRCASEDASRTADLPPAPTL